MLFPQCRVHDVDDPLTLVKAILDERAEHPILLIDAVEERANVSMSTQCAARERH
jgi:hypothetical protein